MLSERYSHDTLAHMLLPKARFAPFPTAEQREPWEQIAADARQLILRNGEAYLNYQWPALPAVRYLDFARDGNRNRYEIPYFQRRHAVGSLALAECVEHQGRFVDDLINGLWAICEESSWVVPAHNTFRNDQPLPDRHTRNIDLFAAETGALLSWVGYLLQPALDAVTPLITQRIVAEVQWRILKPYVQDDGFLWMGFVRRPVNNWNPWCNSNCLSALLLLEPDPDIRTRGVAKGLRSLDCFLADYQADGGCDEGPSYWGMAGGSLFDCLELLRLATAGRIDVYADPLIQNIGRYLYRAHIEAEYFVNFADGGAKVLIYGDLVQRYGRRIGDDQLVTLGLAAFQAHPDHLLSASSWFPMFRVLPHVMNWAELQQTPAAAPHVRDVWLDGIQVMAARERGGSCQGLYLAAKGGHNDESHNHNDVGQFLVYVNGAPLLIDVGVGTYTKQTFSDQRYDIWTMQSAYHNLPTINGAQQHPGPQARAANVSYRADDDVAEFALDLTAAYPESSGVAHWRRTCRLLRGHQPAVVEIVDACRLRRPTDDLTLSLMTACEHDLAEPGALVLHGQDGRDVRLSYDGDWFSATSERIAIADDRLTPIWGDHLYRILLRLTRAAAEAVWTLRITVR
jgi:hypothetical protein